MPTSNTSVSGSVDRVSLIREAAYFRHLDAHARGVKSNPHDDWCAAESTLVQLGKSTIALSVFCKGRMRCTGTLSNAEAKIDRFRSTTHVRVWRTFSLISSSGIYMTAGVVLDMTMPQQQRASLLAPSETVVTNVPSTRTDSECSSLSPSPTVTPSTGRSSQSSATLAPTTTAEASTDAENPLDWHVQMSRRQARRMRISDQVRSSQLYNEQADAYINELLKQAAAAAAESGWKTQVSRRQARRARKEAA